MGLIKPEEMVYVPKRWGYEIWIVNNERYCGKKLFIRQGKWCSYHHHKVKDEVLYIESGRIWMNVSDEVDPKWIYAIDMTPGYAFHVKPDQKHQMHAVEDTIIVEFSTQHFDEDSYREEKLGTKLVRDNRIDPLEYRR